MNDKKTLEGLRAKMDEAEAELDAANARADRLVSLGRFAAEVALDAALDARSAYYKALLEGLRAKMDEAEAVYVTSRDAYENSLEGYRRAAADYDRALDESNE